MTAIFWVTIKEAMRKRTFLIMSIVTVLYLGFYTVALYFFNTNVSNIPTSMGASLVATAGLSFSQSLVMFLTVMLGSGAISPDIESGLIHGILSRPLSRFSYITGKFLGLFALSSVFSTILFSLVILLSGVFGINDSLSLSAGQIIQGWLFYIASPAAMLCLTLLGSIRFKTIPNGILALFIFILGNIGSTVEQVGRLTENADLKAIGFSVSLISPFNATSGKTSETILSSVNSLLDEAVALMSGGGSGLSGLWMLVYIFGYMAVLYALTLFFFRKKDIV